MASDTLVQSLSRVTLGQFLAAVRADRRLSLRQVEEATARQVSNAYLSQLENNKIKEPSPRILYALSEIYAVDYSVLMEKAGYISPSRQPDDADHYARGAAFADMNMTPEEEAELLRFLQFMRSAKPKR